MSIHLQSNMEVMEVIKGRWCCSLCKSPKRYFEDKEDFEYHLKTYCHVCGKTFTSAKIWDIHHQVAHFGQHSKLLADMNRTGHKNSYYCCNCGKMFVTNTAFEAHMAKYKVYQCVGCSKNLSDFISWCGHTNLCQESWRKMDSAKIVRECVACSEKFESLLDCQRHYQTCDFAISRDLMLTKLPRGEVIDGIVRGLSALEGIRKSKKSNFFNIKVPFGFLNSNGHKATLTNETNNNKSEHEETKIKALPKPGKERYPHSGCNGKSASLSLASDTTPMQVAFVQKTHQEHKKTLGHKRANSSPTKDINVQHYEASPKRIKIFPTQTATLAMPTEETIDLETYPVDSQELSDNNQSPSPDRKCNITMPKSGKNQSQIRRGPNDAFTINDFDEKFLESMLNQRPKVFKKFLLKNRIKLLPLMGFSKISNNQWSTQRMIANEKEAEVQQRDTALAISEQPSAEINYESQLHSSLPVDQSDDFTIKDEPIDENLPPSKNLLEDSNANDLPLSSAKKELTLNLSRLKLTKDYVKVTPVSIPNEWIPLNMDDFELLDRQPTVDKPAPNGKNIIRPSFRKSMADADRDHSKVYGWQQDSWINSPVSNNVAITVENSDDGETSVSWCKMSF